MDQTEVGYAIKFFRTGRGMTLKDLANKAGVSLSHLSLIENGHRDPSIKMTKKIADALGVPMIILLFLLEREDVAKLDVDLAAMLSFVTLDSLGQIP